MGTTPGFDMPLEEAMTTQRAIRRLKPDPVDDALLRRLIELALKAFRRKVQKSGLLKELRDRRHYVKPSIAKKIKSAAAQRRSRKRARTSTH